MMKWLIIILLVGYPAMCVELYRVPRGGEFEIIELWWWDGYEAPYPRWPWPDYIAPGRPWPDYPEGWFDILPNIPVRPISWWAPSSQAYTITVFNSSHWITSRELSFPSPVITWPEIPTSGRMLLLTTGPLLVPPLYSPAASDEWAAEVRFYHYFYGDEEITGKYLFASSDWFDDWAVIKLVPWDPNYPEKIIAQINVGDVGIRSKTDWVEFSYEIGDIGQGRAYWLVIGVYDKADTFYPTIFLVDNVKMCEECANAEITGDCKVNFKDFARYAAVYGQDQTIYNDFDGDGISDSNDFIIFMESWLEGKR